MTIGAVRARDQRWWLLAATIAMAAVATFDRLGSERFRAPVGSVIVGPMIAAIACPPLTVGVLVALAMLLRIVLDASDSSIPSPQTGFSLSMVVLLGTIAVGASVVRQRRERELAAARPAQRLTTLSAALAAARSVEEVKEAFEAMARADLKALATRFTLHGQSRDAPPGTPSSFSAPLRVGSGEIGSLDIWFAGPPAPDVVDVLAQAIPQVSVGLSRAQAARSLEVTAQRLGALQRSTSQLTGLLRTDDIAQAMVVEARRALQSDGARILAVDGDAASVVAADDDGDTVELDPDMVAHAMRSGALVVRDDDGASASPGSRGAREGPSVVAPIMGQHGVVAALHLWFDHPHSVDEEERRLVDALSTLIGSAWRRAQLFEQEERERADSVHRAERAARLAALAATLADARDRTAVATAFAEHGVAAVEAVWGAVFELDASKRILRVAAARASGATWSAGATVPLDRPMPLTTAVLEARPVTVGTRAEVLAAHPDESVHPDQQARAAIPLISYGVVIGAVGFAWNEPHRFDDGEIDFLRTIATRTAEALERGRLHEAEREDERRWNLLADASARLAVAMDPDDVLSALVRWAVPLVADTCAVYLAQPNGTARPFVSVDLPDAGGAVQLFEQERIDLASDHPIARLHRARQTLLVEDLADDTVDAAVGDDPQRVDRIRELEIRHAIAAPLSARNQQLGVLVLTMGRSGRSFAANDLELVSDLAARFSIVYDNAVLFATERNIAARLQAALLPVSLQPPPGLDVAVRYEAAGSRAGGDWYDLISFDDGGAALIVGDLVGHGVEAAATMSRYRSALRAHGRMFEDPADVMNAFSSFILRDEAGQTATVLYSRIHPGAAGLPPSLTYCSAGHPPPLVVHEGKVTVLPSPQGPLVGLVGGGYRAQTAELPAGATVILYTDGLLERRGETLDDGLRRLEDVVAALPAHDLERFVSDLLSAMAHDHHDDDIAVIVARAPEVR